MSKTLATKVLTLTGDEAVAEAMRQINPDVVAAYPITPQTEIVMKFAQFVADGVVETEMIPVESEHSAMSACVGSASAGARTMTATSSQGLALMWEIVYIASSLRLPIVMPVVNRALSGNINIHCDHSDSMGARDSGWIQFYCENSQEAYETTILAIKVAEDPNIKLPVMVCQDGFITSHAVERIDIIDDKKVKDYIGEHKPVYSLLDTDNPITVGPLDLQDYYFEHKRAESEAMFNAKKYIPLLLKNFEKVSGKKYSTVQSYKMEDAEYAIIVLSSTAGTARGVVDKLRLEGKKVGFIKPFLFRPFPAEDIINLTKNLKAAAVLDRAESFSAHGGPLYNDIRSALYELDKRPVLTNYIYGLGGRDIFPADIEKVYKDIIDGKPEKINYLGVRE